MDVNLAGSLAGSIFGSIILSLLLTLLVELVIIAGFIIHKLFTENKFKISIEVHTIEEKHK